MKSTPYITFLGPDHLLYLAILILFACILFMNKAFIQEHRKTITPIILTVSLLQQVFLYGSYLMEGFPLSEALPLHISRINTLLGIAFLITQSKKLLPYIAYFSMFAWLSFIYPSRVEPITHIRGISFLTNHVITFLLPFYAMIAYQMSLNPKDKWQAYRMFLLYLAMVLIINPIVDGNYFYLKSKPLIPNAPLPLYLIVVNLVTLCLFYLADFLFITLLQKRSPNYLKRGSNI